MTEGRSGAAAHVPTQPVSHRIIATIATRSGREIEELPRLYDVVDPELLDGLFDAERETLEGYLSFEYAGHRVTVEVGGGIEVEPLE